jgi:anhydro-N-acetylmuramic acid kinase
MAGATGTSSADLNNFLLAESYPRHTAAPSMTRAYIGLMSGTSADAIDGVAATFSTENTQILATHSAPLSEPLQARIKQIVSGAADPLDEVMALDVDLALAFSDCAQQLIEQLQSPPAAIGCHGQTVRHRPQRQFTVQLGRGAIIAAQTGVPTVVDFRSADIALGGQGAPLVPAFHQAVFGSDTEDRAILNIGGIANVTLLGQDGTVGGFDTGPGNTLMDFWHRQHQRGPWDDRGNWSRRGTVDEALLARCLADPYFALAPPKSTGLEYFNPDWLRSQLSGTETPADVQASLRALTARGASDAIRQHHRSARKVYLCGGGARNDALVDEFRSALPGVEIATTTILGIEPQWVEACAFAWLARQRIRQEPGNVPAVTGASRPAVLGALYNP